MRGWIFGRIGPTSASSPASDEAACLGGTALDCMCVIQLQHLERLVVRALGDLSARARGESQKICTPARERGTQRATVGAIGRFIGRRDSKNNQDEKGDGIAKPRCYPSAIAVTTPVR